MNNKTLPFVCSKIALGPHDAVISAILEAHNDKLALVESNTNIITREFTTRQDKIYVDVRLNETSSKISTLSVPRFLVDVGKLNILDLITSAIDNDHYVSVHIDSGKIQFYTRYGMVAPHYITIYGYDLAKEILFCSDFFSGKYTTKEISISNFINAFDGMKEVAKYIGNEANYCRIYWRIDLNKYLKKEEGKQNPERLIRIISDIYNGKNIYGETELYKRKWNPHFTYDEELQEAEISREQYGINALRRLREQHKKGTENDRYLLTMRQYYSFYFFSNKISEQIKTLLDYYGENMDCDLLQNMSQMKLNAERLYNLYIKSQIKEDQQYSDRITKLMDEIINNVENCSRAVLHRFGTDDLGRRIFT